MGAAILIVIQLGLFFIYHREIEISVDEQILYDYLLQYRLF